MTSAQKILALLGVSLIIITLLGIAILLGFQFHIYTPPFITLKSNVSGVKITWQDRKTMETIVNEIIVNRRQTQPGESSPQEIKHITITLTSNPQTELITYSGENQIASSNYEYNEKNGQLTILIYIKSLAQKTKITNSQISNLTDAFVTEKILTTLLAAVPPKTPPNASDSWSIADYYKNVAERYFLKGKTTGTYPIHITIQ